MQSANRGRRVACWTRAPGHVTWWKRRVQQEASLAQWSAMLLATLNRARWPGRTRYRQLVHTCPRQVGKQAVRLVVGRQQDTEAVEYHSRREVLPVSFEYQQTADEQASRPLR